jgi:Mn2+/Fe2+ NRAMP family transporter
MPQLPFQSPLRRARRSIRLLAGLRGPRVARLPERRRLWLPPLAAQRLPRLALLAVIGPGIVSGFADNDAGGITTYSVVGAQYGYALLWAVLASLVALFFTQEVGARLGLATGRGLLDLIREHFGPRWGVLAITTMLLANLGDTIAEFAGIGAALSLFGVPVATADAVAAVVIVVLLSRGSFRRVQFVFLGIGAGVSVAYAVSAVLAHPDWAHGAEYLVVPHGTLSTAYLLAIVGTVGTTITPWGQAFIQSYTADKRLGPEDLRGSRIDVATGAFLTNVVAAFIVVAAAATLWEHGVRTIPDAKAAAQALGPLAGHLAETVFALGLLAASFLGLGAVPLTSAYATTEALGLERGLDLRVRQAPAFYGLLAFFVGVAAVFVLIPGLPLIQVMYLSQVFDGALLPVILVFVMLLAHRRDLLGDLVSGRLLLWVGWAIAGLISILSVALVITLLFP